MTISKRIITIVVATGLLALVAVPAVSGRGMLASPTVVVTVDLPAVLDGLTQRADAETDLRRLADGVLEEDEARKAELNALQQQHQDEVDDDARGDLEEQIALATLQYQAWVRFTSDKLDVERALLLQSLYRSVKDAIRAMSETEGFDLVLIDDSAGELGVSPELQVSRETQIKQQMTGRRILYGSDALNITDDLIARMNNAYMAGTSGP